MRTIRRLASGLALVAAALILPGCAVESLPYPSLSTEKKLEADVMSREEQDAVIKDLSTVQKQHESSAIQEIEKKP